MFLSFLSCSLFSHAANPRAVIVKCDSCAYDVDVSNRHLLFSQYLLNMCSELLVMNLYIRVLGFASTKVMSLFYKSLMRSLSCAGGDFVCPGAATGSQIG